MMYISIKRPGYHKSSYQDPNRLSKVIQTTITDNVTTGRQHRDHMMLAMTLSITQGVVVQSNPKCHLATALSIVGSGALYALLKLNVFYVRMF